MKKAIYVVIALGLSACSGAGGRDFDPTSHLMTGDNGTVYLNGEPTGSAGGDINITIDLTVNNDNDLDATLTDGEETTTLTSSSESTSSSTATACSDNSSDNCTDNATAIGWFFYFPN
jgi:hypothetical protein